MPKEAEGNPQAKGRIRKLQRQMRKRRMLQEVKQATVVITNQRTLLSRCAMTWKPWALRGCGQRARTWWRSRSADCAME